MIISYCTHSELKATLKSLCSVELASALEQPKKKAQVVVAHDTRASCPLLLDAFGAGVEKMSGVLTNYGLLTTPQLHYMVRCLNTSGAYGEPDEHGYFLKLSQAFFNIWTLVCCRPYL